MKYNQHAVIGNFAVVLLSLTAKAITVCVNWRSISMAEAESSNGNGMSSERRPTGGSESASWVKVQKQTFTAWVNDRLKTGQVDKVVEDLKTQFADGLTLIKLLEVLAPHQKMLK